MGKFREILEMLNESFHNNDWVHMNGNSFEVYGIVIEPLKNGGAKVISCTVDGGRVLNAKTDSTKNWNPQPKVIAQSDVPEKVVKKILKKREKMGWD